MDLCGPVTGGEKLQKMYLAKIETVRNFSNRTVSGIWPGHKPNGPHPWTRFEPMLETMHMSALQYAVFSVDSTART